MTQEEKAKAYDEAIEKAKEYFNSPRTCFDIEQLCNVFPELKESEDERIRKALLDYFDNANKVDENQLQSYGIHTDKVIAWLEKQKSLVDEYEDKLDKCACDNFNKGYKVALEKQGEQKPAWSEKDGRMLQNILDCLRNGYTKLPSDILQIESWLKSLRPQKQWKPSDEQMKALYEETQESDRIRDVRIVSLYEDLKKLMEE